MRAQKLDWEYRSSLENANTDMANIKKFVETYGNQFNLKGLSSDDRDSLVQSITATLQKNIVPDNSPQFVVALNALRILSRDKTCIDVCMHGRPQKNLCTKNL